MFWITAGGSRQKKILAGTDADFFCHGQQNAVMHAVHLTNIADQKNSGLEAQSDTRGECSPLLLVSHVDSNTNCGMVEPPQLFFYAIPRLLSGFCILVRQVKEVPELVVSRENGNKQ